VEALFAISKLPPGVSAALQGFFCVLERLIIAAGIYMFRKREKLFAYKGKEGDTYASANPSIGNGGSHLGPRRDFHCDHGFSGLNGRGDSAVENHSAVTQRMHY